MFNPHRYNSEWYTLPARARSILFMMMMRCNVPCTITAGKIAIMSIEKFNTVNIVADSKTLTVAEHCCYTTGGLMDNFWILDFAYIDVVLYGSALGLDDCR